MPTQHTTAFGPHETCRSPQTPNSLSLAVSGDPETFALQQATFMSNATNSGSEPLVSIAAYRTDDRMSRKPAIDRERGGRLHRGHLVSNDDALGAIELHRGHLVSNDDALGAIEAAIKAGYPHIDTASGYRNEEAVGAGTPCG